MAKSLYAKKTYLGAGSSIFISQMIINNLCAAIADKTIHKIVYRITNSLNKNIHLQNLPYYTVAANCCKALLYWNI